jgi:hypothetical protein
VNDLTRLEERFRQANPVPDPFDPPMTVTTAATTLLDLEERKVTMQATTVTEPTKRGPQRPLLIAARVAAVVLLLGVGLFAMFTAARDSREVATENQAGVFATSIEDVAGRWRASEFPWYIELTQDGTHAYGVDEPRLEENLAGRPDGTYRFEGNVVYLESRQCKIRDIVEPGIYRIRLVAPDVIQFEPIEETCEVRRTSFAVDSGTFQPVTWSRVED